MPAAPSLTQEIANLQQQLDSVALPPELKLKTSAMIQRLHWWVNSSVNYTSEYDRVAQYISWIVALPWGKTSQDRLDLASAATILDQHHHGMNQVKERILEYLAVMQLTRDRQDVPPAPILCLVGLVGTGKTTFALSLAEALKRQYVRIPFGGLGSARDLRGQSRLHPDAEPGLIIKALRRSQTSNPVILLDEIDRVVESARADVMAVLVELLDPEQNFQFTDHFLDYPFDLSQVLFLATANNTRNIATAVLDRLEVIQMPSYSDAEKIIIAQNYVLPQALKQSGLSEDNLTIDKDVWPKIVRPLGYDAGIRTLERTIQGICRKIAKQIVLGKGKHFHLTLNNIKNYLPNW
jgi:ATP-dependent Lon protease